VTYRIDSQEMEGAAIAVVTLTGTSDYDTITGMLRELDQLAPRLIFIDEAQFKPDLLSGIHIQEFAKQWRNAAALRAARMSVHAPNPVMYGLNRMFQLWAGAEDKMAVFRDRDEALAWLLRRDQDPAG
jgi:hypothetical protein